jgi:hypothetical protein
MCRNALHAAHACMAAGLLIWPNAQAKPPLRLPRRL